MSVSGCQLSAKPLLVLDTSVVINLIATGKAADVVAALPYRCVVTDVVLGELDEGKKYGHKHCDFLRELIASAHVELVNLSEPSLEVFELLVTGEGSQSLDDGEASTIAFALAATGTAAIDERKARRISSERFPSLPVLRSVELLFHEDICDAFGLAAQADLVFQAIFNGRMEVGQDYITRVIQLIGAQRAARCKSLGLR